MSIHRSLPTSRVLHLYRWYFCFETTCFEDFYILLTCKHTRGGCWQFLFTVTGGNSLESLSMSHLLHFIVCCVNFWKTPILYDGINNLTKPKLKLNFFKPVMITWHGQLTPSMLCSQLICLFGKGLGRYTSVLYM